MSATGLAMVVIMGYDDGLRYEHGYGNSYGPCYGYSAQGGLDNRKGSIGLLANN